MFPEYKMSYSPEAMIDWIEYTISFDKKNGPELDEIKVKVEL